MGSVFEAEIQYPIKEITYTHYRNIYTKTEFNLMVFIFVVQWNTFFYLGIGGRNQLMGSLLDSKEDVSFSKRFLV